MHGRRAGEGRVHRRGTRGVAVVALEQVALVGLRVREHLLVEVEGEEARAEGRELARHSIDLRRRFTLAGLAIFIASMNVFGGFMVTYKMLKMFFN